MADATLPSLLEDEGTARALATVLARAESGDGTVTWEAVSDGIDAEQWGTLVASGILVPAGDAFVIDDPPAVRRALDDAGFETTTSLSEDTDAPAVEMTDSPSGWRPADKLAGVAAVLLLAGYQVSAIKSPVTETVNLVLGPVAGVLPFSVVLTLLAVGAAVVSTAVRRRLVDQEWVEGHRAGMREVRDRLDAARERGDEAAVERLSQRQQELMRTQLGMFKHIARPMAWTMLVTVPVFLWLSWAVVTPQAAVGVTTPALPVVGRMVWTARVIGPLRLWMAWYAVSMLVSNLAAKRAMKRAPDRLPLAS